MPLRQGIPVEFEAGDFLCITLNGKHVSCSSEVVNVAGTDILLQVFLPCPGGKGGFGSMLRAIGAQIEKTTNKDACRDLSGRRLRDVNAEKKIKEYIAKQAKRKEQENKKRKEKLARLRREPKIEFKDEEYFKNRSLLPEVVDDAVTQGMKKVLSATQRKTAPTATVTSATASSCSTTAESEPVSVSGTAEEKNTIAATTSSLSNHPQKRKAAAPAAGKKKLKCLWLGVDEDVSSDDE